MIAAARDLATLRWTPYVIPALAGAVLFAFGLGTHPIGRDEAVSVLAARHPIPVLLDLIVHHEPHPAGYYLALAVWPHDTLVEARLFSFLPAVLTIPVIVAAARRLDLPGWPAGILAATAPFLGFYSVEARMYSWLAFVGALALLAVAAIENRAARGAAVQPVSILLGLVLALAGYIHYFAVFLGVAAIGLLVTRRRFTPAAVAIGTAIILYLPGLVMLAAQVPVLRRYPNGTWQAREDPAHVFQAFSVLLAGGDSFAPAFVATAILVVVIAVALVRGRHHAGTRLAGYWLLPTLALPLAIGAAVPLDSPRYLAAAFPALVLLLAAATRRPGRAAVILTVLLATLGTALVVDSFHRTDDTKPPIPAVVALAGPGRLVVAQHVFLAPELAFYVHGPVAHDFGPPAIDRTGQWALPPAAAFPPSPPQPLLLVNYCGRLQPPPPGYTVVRKFTFAVDVCAELVDPS